MNNPLNGRQSYPGAFKRVCMMQALKYSKQFIYIFHIKARAVIPYEYHYLIRVSIGTTDFDFGFGLRTGELNRIRKQVDQYQPEHGPVPIAHRKLIDFPGNIAAICL